MRFRQLGIETQRQAPSNARTEGFALLVRAAYLTREGRPTTLGQKAFEHLLALSGVGPEEMFGKLRLPVILTEAGIFYAISNGEVEVLQCPSCHYASRREIAGFKKPSLPPEPLLPLERVATPDCHTIESLAGFLGIPREKTAKALMFTRISDGKFIFVAVRGDMQMSEAKLKKLVGEVRLATPEEAAKAGAEAGYASPVGLKDALIVLDDLIPQSANLVAGANEPGYHLRNTNYPRDYNAHLVADVALAETGHPCPRCGTPLGARHAKLLHDAEGYQLHNILLALAETHHDDKGLTLPVGAAPFDVYLMQVTGREMDTRSKAEEIDQLLEQAGFSVLFDDRQERAGVKFNDADLIGCPVRVTVGEKNMQAGMVELKARKEKENRLIPMRDLNDTLQQLLKLI